ncbi:MAG: N-formylglutamate amidohydrolase [Pseudomonadota bacterium]
MTSTAPFAPDPFETASIAPALLAPDEPDPAVVHRPDGASPFFLTCDHGGRLIPRRLADLGLPGFERERHIAWDIGAAGLARQLSARLDAILVRQVYSRLVADCNRPPEAPDFVAAKSELTRIPGNRDLPPAEIAARREEVWRPYHDRITALLDRRQAAGRPILLIAVHSFTPVYKGQARPWHVGLLYNRDARMADAIRPLLRAARVPAASSHPEAGRPLVVGDNEPYRLSDATDYTVPVHGEKRGLVSLEIEIRQDLIESAQGQAAWAALFEGMLREIAPRFV